MEEALTERLFPSWADSLDLSLLPASPSLPSCLFPLDSKSAVHVQIR